MIIYGDVISEANVLVINRIMANKTVQISQSNRRQNSVFFYAIMASTSCSVLLRAFPFSPQFRPSFLSAAEFAVALHSLDVHCAAIDFRVVRPPVNSQHDAPNQPIQPTRFWLRVQAVI